MRRAVGFAKVLLWVCAGLMAVLVVLSWAAPGLRGESSFLLLGGVAVVPVMVCSAFLLWWELRANRRELRAARRESRDIPFEEGAEWTSKVWFYVLALFLSFSLSWYVLPALLLSLFWLSRSHGFKGEASTGYGPRHIWARSEPVDPDAWKAVPRSPGLVA